MNILLIKPETVGIFSYTYLVEHEPLEMEYLYTVFTAMGHHAVIYDRRYELTSMKKKIREVNPDVICVTGYITQQKLVHRYCDVIKAYRPEIQIILGGSNVEINYENYFDSKADYLYHLSGLENQKKLIRYIEQEKNHTTNVGETEELHLEDIAGICYRKDGEWVVNPKVVETPADLPIPDRTHFYKNMKHFR